MSSWTTLIVRRSWWRLGCDSIDINDYFKLSNGVNNPYFTSLSEKTQLCVSKDIRVRVRCNSALEDLCTLAAIRLSPRPYLSPSSPSMGVDSASAGAFRALSGL